MYSVSILVRSNGFNSLCVHYKGARINIFLFPEEIWGQKVKGVNTFHEFKKVRKFQGSTARPQSESMQVHVNTRYGQQYEKQFLTPVLLALSSCLTVIPFDCKV